MNHQRRITSPRVIIQMLVFIVVIPFLPLLISRQWDWAEAWVYALLSVLGFVISRILASRRHPDLLAERARFLQHEDATAWDKTLAPLLGIGGALVMLVVGLEAAFYESPPYSLPVKIISLVACVVGYALGAYALIENRFFSGVVRIQSERGHQVVSSGPYRWVRHPGYAGAILMYLATPLLLDSAWAFIPTGFLVVILVVRTRLEDRFLQDNLHGYPEYTQGVRYRLLPGVW